MNLRKNLDTTLPKERFNRNGISWANVIDN